MNGVSFQDAFLGLDISTKCTGWALVRGRHYETGHARLKNEHFGVFLKLFQHFIKDLVTQKQPAVICVERPFVGNTSAVGPIYKMHGVLELTLAGYVGAFDDVAHSTWKAEICNNGRISTAEKNAGMVVNILRRMDFEVDQIDEADALAIALHERKKLTGRIK